MKSIDIHKYNTWIFDCDGVILDSNRIKTDAFRHIASEFGSDITDRFILYHKDHGGISRYEKISFLQKLVKDKIINVSKLTLDYGDYCRREITKCDEVTGFSDFITLVSGKKTFVVSGGDERELREVFKGRGIDKYFNAIYGSPMTKGSILHSMDVNKDIDYPAVYIGDSKYDHDCVSNFDIDFIFMSEFSDFSGWEDYCKEKSIVAVSNYLDLL